MDRLREHAGRASTSKPRSATIQDAGVTHHTPLRSVSERFTRGGHLPESGICPNFGGDQEGQARPRYIASDARSPHHDTGHAGTPSWRPDSAAGSEGRTDSEGLEPKTCQQAIGPVIEDDALAGRRQRDSTQSDRAGMVHCSIQTAVSQSNRRRAGDTSGSGLS
jgi:hypothetical protein